jgi:hypothetical protein
MNFSLNQKVSYQNHTGFISFITDEYITICINEKDKSPEEQLVAKNPKEQCNLVIFKEDLDEVKLIHVG